MAASSPWPSGLDGLQEPAEVLDCGTRTTMRLMLGLLAGRDGRHFVLDGDAFCAAAPMRRVANRWPRGVDVRGRDDATAAGAGGHERNGDRTPVASASEISPASGCVTAESFTTVIEPAQSRTRERLMPRPRR